MDQRRLFSFEEAKIEGITDSKRAQYIEERAVNQQNFEYESKNMTPANVQPISPKKLDILVDGDYFPPT